MSPRRKIPLKKARKARPKVASVPLWIPCDYCDALAKRCVTGGERSSRRFACDDPQHTEFARALAPNVIVGRSRYEWLDLDAEIMPGLRAAHRLLAKQTRAIERLQRDIAAAGGSMTYTLTMHFDRGTPALVPAPVCEHREHVVKGRGPIVCADCGVAIRDIRFPVT